MTHLLDLRRHEDLKGYWLLLSHADEWTVMITAVMMMMIVVEESPQDAERSQD